MTDQLQIFDNEENGSPESKQPTEKNVKRRDNIEKRALHFMNDCCPRCAFENYRGQQCVHYMDFHYWVKTFSAPDENGYPRRMVCRYFLSRHFKSLVTRHTPIPCLVDKPRETVRTVMNAVTDPDDIVDPMYFGDGPYRSPDDAA